MVSILNEMFMNIYYIYVCVCVYMKQLESMVTLCYKDKVKLGNAKKQRKLYPIFYKMFKRIKRM